LSSRPVDLVVTEMAAVGFPNGHATLLETGPGVTIEAVITATEAELRIAWWIGLTLLAISILLIGAGSDRWRGLALSLLRRSMPARALVRGGRLAAPFDEDQCGNPQRAG
jgi:hypothetical protein